MADYLIKDTTLTDIGNAIREKTEKTDNILVANFAEEIRNISSGAELNFDVVAYATEEEMLAATPSENTIGVVTNTNITGWYFGIEAPTISNGLVWISTGVSSAVEFNALKKNSIQVYPISAKQYISGVWVYVTSMSYHGGGWKNIIRYIFHDGVLSEITGFISVRGTETIADTITLVTDKNAFSHWYSKEKIDITDVDAIRVVLNESSYSYPSGNTPCLAVSTTIPSQSSTSSTISGLSAFVGFTAFDGTSNRFGGEFLLDVSELSGEVYLVFGCNGISGSTVCQLIIEELELVY